VPKFIFSRVHTRTHLLFGEIKMRRNLNKTRAATLILLVAFLLAIANQNINPVVAQSDVATVIVMPTNGGTTDPAAGMYTYSNGTTITIKAIPDSGYTFSYWLISGDLLTGHTTAQSQPSTIIDPDTGQVVQAFPSLPRSTVIDTLTFQTNPANITCGYGYSYTYTAIFAPINQPSPAPGSSDAIVIVMPTTGGTVSPAAGSHTYSNGTAIVLSATPDSGYVFKYWLISGQLTSGHPTGAPSQLINPDTGEVTMVPRPAEPTSLTAGIDSLTFTTNPTHITCGYGYTYTYTAVFEKVAATASPALTSTPVASTASPIPTSTPVAQAGTDWTLVIIAAVIVIVVIIAAVAAVMMRKKKYQILSSFFCSLFSRQLLCSFD
jgi:hypothetical protein